MTKAEELLAKCKAAAVVLEGVAEKHGTSISFVLSGLPGCELVREVARLGGAEVRCIASHEPISGAPSLIEGASLELGGNVQLRIQSSRPATAADLQSAEAAQ